MMNARRATILVLMLGVVAAAICFWVLASHSTREARHAVIAESGKRAEISQALKAAQARSTAAEAARQELGAQLRKMREAQAGSSTPAVRDAVRDDPKLQLMRLLLNKAKYAGQYAAFYSRARPTREQIDKLEAALAQRDEAKMDIQDAGLAFGAAQAMGTLSKDANAACQAQVEQILGSEGARAFADYERTLPARDFAAQLSASAIAAGGTVNRDTVERVIEVICRACPDFDDGKPVKLATVDWKTVDQQVAQLLTPSQFRWFTNSAERAGTNFSVVLLRALTADGLIPAD